MFSTTQTSIDVTKIRENSDNKEVIDTRFNQNIAIKLRFSLFYSNINFENRTFLSLFINIARFNPMLDFCSYILRIPRKWQLELVQLELVGVVDIAVVAVK